MVDSCQATLRRCVRFRARSIFRRSILTARRNVTIPARKGLCGILLLLAGFLSTAWSQPVPPTEYDVKAAFLYNFGKFVQWPPEAFEGRDSFVFCLLGDDSFGQVLNSTVVGKKIQERVLVVRQLRDVSDTEGCHILFISRSEGWRLPRVLSSLRSRSVLTVGETVGFTERGGIISFRVEDNRVRFDINLAAAQRAQLTISSQLLKLARAIIPPGDPGA
jgi:hypothetical protein